AVSALAQLSTVAVVLGAALGCAVAAASGPKHGVRRTFRVPVPVAGLPSAGFACSFSPRPPPLA
ncbi:MAG: hypothetical protein ACM3H9_03375, partial [Rhodospirillaceae bacterium]